MLKKRGLIIFWLFLILNCYFIYTGQHLQQTITKAVLVPILLFYIFLNARKNYYKNSKSFIFSAFICAWFGDIFLVNKGDTFFLLGMLAFACAHILFAITFYRIHKLRILKSQEAFIAAIILVVAFYELYNFITPGLGNFKIPVIIYMLVISTMAIMAVNLLSSGVRKASAMMFFIPGALLFIVSDALLALQIFMFSDIDLLGISVMLSYGYALSLFADGFTKLLKG